MIENPLPILIPNFSGDLHIFDMDDTLFWSPEWHNIIETNEEGVALGVDENLPNVFGAILSLIDDMNNYIEDFIRRDKNGVMLIDLLDEYKRDIGHLNLTKKIFDLPELGKVNQTVFVLTDKSNAPVSIDNFKKYFPSKHTKKFDTRGKYVKDIVVVAGDYRFYQSPETLGWIPNEEIINIYKNNSNAIILTARETAPGMSEGILDRLNLVGADEPIAIFTKPKGFSGSDYKGHILGQIAQQPDVKSINFYDDNLRYITGSENILKNIYGKEVFEKVTITLVSVENKPKESFIEKESQKFFLGFNLLKIANELDNRSLTNEANFTDKILINLING